MDLRIQNQGQPELDSVNLKSLKEPGGASGGPPKSSVQALNVQPDTAAISPASSQLSDDVAIRQDRVDALRSQLEGGTYRVNAHAVATAMFQNLFRS
jgi:flagellar biosynthesis anti-sigma factor FlgM